MLNILVLLRYFLEKLTDLNLVGIGFLLSLLDWKNRITKH